SGVDVVRSLEILIQQEPNERMRFVCHGVLRRVLMDGVPVSSACSLYPKIFPQAVLLFLQSGEASGDLSGRAEQAAHLLEREVQMRDRLVQSLTVPTFTMVICLLLVWGVITFIFPRLLEMFDNLHADLPWITKMVILIVNILNNPFIVGGFFVGVGLIFWKRARMAQLAFNLALHIPIARKLVGDVLAVGFCDVVGHLYQDGVALPVALNLLIQNTNAHIHVNHLRRVLDQFRTDGSLSSSVQQIEYFPGVVAEMLVVGEESGRLASVLLSTARMLDEDLYDLLQRVVVIIEPVTMMIVGGIMCFFMLGLFLPIYQMLQVVGN
ncbi:MAG: type II secretion system F family protein, partial [Candidatus Xenobia bacterium]